MAENLFTRHQGYHRPLGSQLSTASSNDQAKEPTPNMYIFEHDPQASEQTLPPLSTDTFDKRSKGALSPLVSSSTVNTQSFGWILETTACLGSLISFAAIIVVLRIYNQKALPDWPLHITLNTFLAFCVTFSKACFMISLAESISQWKWNIYCNTTQGRPLGDFHILDLASRGFWGSCRLIGRFHWRHIVTLAGIISILSGLTSPITQQVLDYPSRRVADSSSAAIPISQHWEESDMLFINKAISDGLSSFVDKPPPYVIPACSTGNCTFPKSMSLAVCVKTADVSDKLHVSTITNSTDTEWTIGGAQGTIPNGTTAYNASLPNGVKLITPLSYAANAQGADTSLAFVNDEANFAALADYFVIYSRAGNVSYPGYNRTEERQWPFGAFEVLLYLCVNEYAIKVDAGVPSTEVISSSVSPVANVKEGNKVVGLPRLSCHYPFGKIDRRLYCDDSKEKSRKTLAFQDPSSGAAGKKSNFSFSAVTALSTSYNLNLAMFSQYIYSGSPRETAVLTADSAMWLSNALWGLKVNITDKEEQFARVGRYYDGLATSLSNQFVLS
ncbi:hypothetical protein ACHAPU_006349 [Fusarium lateritium]